MTPDPSTRSLDTGTPLSWNRSLVLTLLLCTTALAQKVSTFETEASLVRVDVGVNGGNEDVITGLSRSDFRVWDEWLEQVITAFDAEQEPLDLILLFDISSSMRSKIAAVANVAHQVLGELRSGDRVGVMTFDEYTRSFSGFTDELDLVERDIQRVLDMHFTGGTHIQQAIDDAARRFLRDKRTFHRRAVLIITDNQAFRARNEKAIIRNLWEADVVLSGLILNSWSPARILLTPLAHRAADLGGVVHIAEQTGGDSIRSDDPSSAFGEMMRRIRSRYSLYYKMPDGQRGSFRKIRVELTEEARRRLPAFRIYARRGYQVRDE